MCTLVWLSFLTIAVAVSPVFHTSWPSPAVPVLLFIVLPPSPVTSESNVQALFLFHNASSHLGLRFSSFLWQQVFLCFYFLILSDWFRKNEKIGPCESLKNPWPWSLEMWIPLLGCGLIWTGLGTPVCLPCPKPKSLKSITLIWLTRKTHHYLKKLYIKDDCSLTVCILSMLY